VRIEEELRAVEAVPRARVVRPVDPKAVPPSRARLGQIAMPHLVGALLERDARPLVVAVRPVEEAELDAGRALGEEREVDARAVPGRAERIGLAGPDPHARAIERLSLARPARRPHRHPSPSGAQIATESGGSSTAPSRRTAASSNARRRRDRPATSIARRAAPRLHAIATSPRSATSQRAASSKRTH